MEILLDYSPVVLTLFATIFTWLMTMAGSAMVFFFKEINKKILNGMLGFAAGIMIAASFTSLLLPAMEMSKEQNIAPWLPVTIGFISGGLFLFIVDRILPHLHLGLPDNKAEGIQTSWERSILLVLAITLHNIPEGLAVGVTFGSLKYNPDISHLASAIAIALGIGIQNFPEGAAVSIPLRREGFSRVKAFQYGQISGIVEPLFGILGAMLVGHIKPILPYALSFAAGAMMFVVIEELIPESQTGQETDLSTLGALIGFTLMMLLDTIL